MSKLLEISKNYKLQADKLLSESGLINTLNKYGEVHFVGAYAGDVMMHGDIDMAVVRDQAYSLEEIFAIFKDIYFGRKFISYFLDGDWNNPKKGKEYPNGYYIGMKDIVDNEKWKFDIWFLSKEEFIKRSELLSIDKIELTESQKELILLFKQYRKENKLNIMGQTIYKAVLENNSKTTEDLEQYFKI
ncbi:MAG: hypothetical protein WCI91_04010 [Candidatus Nomurabacteria bacterium]